MYYHMYEWLQAGSGLVAVQFIVTKLKVNYNAYMHLNFSFYNKPKYLHTALTGGQQLNDLWKSLSDHNIIFVSGILYYTSAHFTTFM
jgi:hypothetical protein